MAKADVQSIRETFLHSIKFKPNHMWARMTSPYLNMWKFLPLAGTNNNYFVELCQQNKLENKYLHLHLYLYHHLSISISIGSLKSILDSHSFIQHISIVYPLCIMHCFWSPRKIKSVSVSFVSSSVCHEVMGPNATI